MNYICSTQNRAAPGYASALQKVGRASSPTNFYPEAETAMDCPVFSKRQPTKEPGESSDNTLRKEGQVIDNLFREPASKLTTFFSISQNTLFHRLKQSVSSLETLCHKR